MPHPTSTVPIEDGSRLTRAAWKALVEHRRELGASKLAIKRLDSFLAGADKHPLNTKDRGKILNQASVMLKNLYPHLPFKLEEFQFTHPVTWLEKNVRPFIGTMSEVEFHGCVIAAFSLVRDAHTLYGLPSPFRGAVAFLPFQMRFYVTDGQRRYVVSKVMHGFDHEAFQPGAEIYTWGSGSKVDNFVQAVAGRLSGGNCDAVFSRGTFHMTLRPLTFCQPPGEEELRTTIIEYSGPGETERRRILLPWGVATGIDQGQGLPNAAFSVNSSHAHAGDWDGAMHDGCHPSRKPATKAASKRRTTPAEAALSLASKVPEAFEVQFTGGPFRPGLVDPEVLDTDPPSDARIGYIRIKRFSDGSSLGDTEALVSEFRRLLTLMDEVAPDGLILDLRSNPGGDVIAAEQMLQMLTPTDIQPALFHLANTSAVVKVLRRLAKKRVNRGRISLADDVKLTDALVALDPWIGDANNVPLPKGERLTSGQPLTDVKDANRIGQVYHGRACLVIDALTYSAAEIFAAGFQDHAIGQIIGMDHNTGGGGANVWTHNDLVKRLGPISELKLEPLPSDTTMSVAIRRNSRVGFFNGQWVEDVGVKADVTYVPDSVDDVVFDYPGLIHTACNMIMAVPQFRADVVEFAMRRDGGVKIELRTINIDAIDVYLDGKKVLSRRRVKRLPRQGPSRPVVIVPAAAGNKSPAAMKIVAFALAPGRKGEELMLAAVYNVGLQAPAAPEAEANEDSTSEDSTTVVDTTEGSGETSESPVAAQ